MPADHSEGRQIDVVDGREPEYQEADDHETSDDGGIATIHGHRQEIWGHLTIEISIQQGRQLDLECLAASQAIFHFR